MSGEAVSESNLKCQLQTACQLQIGSCQEHRLQLNNKGVCHLPLQRLSPELLQLLTFNTP